jgi:ABC-2 type transport system ATP-binding protein
MGEITNINVNHLTFAYRYGEKVFNDITLSIKSGAITGLVGRNGQGKTTLMKMLAGKFEADSGNISITIDSEEKNPARDIEAANEIVYVTDKSSDDKALKLSGIIEEFAIMYENFDMDFAKKLLTIFDIDLKKKIKKISKGQECLFNFACAMATRAAITILDEPVAGVDAINRKKVYDIILRDYMEHPRTIIISSHMLGEMETILSEIVMIGSKSVLFQGEIEEMKKKAFRVSGEAEKVDNFIRGKEVLFHQNNMLESMAVVEETYDEQLAKQAAELELTVTSLTAEEYYVYATGNHSGEELEKLWEKQN